MLDDIAKYLESKINYKFTVSNIKFVFLFFYIFSVKKNLKIVMIISEFLYIKLKI